MSHYTYYHLKDDVEITNFEGLMKYFASLKDNTSLDAMPSLVQISAHEKLVEDTPTRKVIEKRYVFIGLYPEESKHKEIPCFWGNGDYGINHGRPEDLKEFIGEMSKYMGSPIEFFAFEEGWPTDESGYASNISAEAGRVSIIPMRLMEDWKTWPTPGRETRRR